MKTALFPDMPPIHIHPHEVEQLLSGLKLHKASKPDMIPSYLLKLLAHQLAPALTLLYQASCDNFQKIGKQLMFYPFLRRVTDLSPPIIGQYHLPAYAARSWNTLSIPTSYTIFKDVIFYAKSSMASEVAGHVKPNC